MKEFLEKVATQIATEFHLDKDAILGINENIFYFINNNEIIEVERKTHLSKCIYNGTKVSKLLESFNTLKDYLL